VGEVLTPDQLADEGQSAYHRGEYLSAAKSFQAAADGFNSDGDTFKAAEMANNCSVALLKHGDPQAALDVVEGTETIFQEKGDFLRQALAIGNRGAALDELGQVENASAAYKESAKLLKQIGEFELRAHVMQSLSALQLQEGHHLQAYTTMLAGVEGIEKPNPKQRLLKSLMHMPFKIFNGP
jgi:tetratricopeptide (TPR) repeat protein